MPRARSRLAAAPAASPPRRRARGRPPGRARAGARPSRRRWNSAALKALAMAVLLFVLTQIGILGGDTSVSAGHLPGRDGDGHLHAAGLHDRPLGLQPHAGARGSSRRNPDGGALADGRAGPGEHLDRPPGGREQGAADRSGRRAGHAARARCDELDATRRGDPDHALPLRPRRRGRRDGARDRRAGLLPRGRGLHPREHQRLRALPGLRAVRVLHARADGQGRRQAAARRASRST